MIEQLNCDKCGTHLGWSTNHDLNGESFYCDSCAADMEKRPPYIPPPPDLTPKTPPFISEHFEKLYGDQDQNHV